MNKGPLISSIEIFKPSMNPYTFIRAKLLETRNWLKVRHCLSLYRNLYIESQFYLTLYSYEFTRFPLLSALCRFFMG